MATQVKRRRGTAAENASFTGAAGEIVALTDTGQLAVHDAATAGGKVIPNAQNIQNNTVKYGTVGGTGNTITLAHSVPRTAHTTGAEIIFKPTANNTSAVTVAVDSIAGTKAIEKMVSGTSTALTADDLRNGVVARAIYDGTRYQLQGTSGGLENDVQTFTSSGTWTKPSGYATTAMALLEVWGGGGAGASILGNSGGGGGGAYASTFCPLSSLSATETITIGAAGVAVAAWGNNGGDGGTSSIGSRLTAAGGKGGTSSIAGVGGLASASTTNIKSTARPINVADGGDGGYGAAAVATTFAGGGGGGGAASSKAGATSTFSGDGGASSVAGTQPAGGGGGGIPSVSYGANGAKGQVRITVFG